MDEFEAFQKKRIEESGTTWFLDYTVNGRASMIKKDNWKYCFYVNDREELYNLEEDPMEVHNLAYKEEYSAKKEEMKALWMEQVMIKSMTEITE